jgi:hypothetical protein
LVVLRLSLFSPGKNWLIQSFEAEAGWRVWSLALLLVMLPVGWFLVSKHSSFLFSASDL